MKNVIECWDDKAAQWKDYVGEHGDNNRVFHSDPVLWRFLGDVSGQKMIDAGCGTGYLTLQLARKGASVVGVDISAKMIEQARAFSNEGQSLETHKSYGRKLDIEFREESMTDLTSFAEGSIGAIVSNYALMDTPDLRKTVQSFHRILKAGGLAVLVFSHPCFNSLAEDEMYFDEIEKKEKWGPFKTDFVYFHRPLSQYWRTFQEAGFVIEDFDEPLANPNQPGFREEWKKIYRKRPFSVAFKLRKAGGLTFID